MKIRKLSDYNNKKLCECFNCFNLQNANTDITQTNIELKDTETSQVVTLERGKFLSYFGTRFGKIDANGVIHIFRDYL